MASIDLNPDQAEIAHRAVSNQRHGYVEAIKNDSRTDDPSMIPVWEALIDVCDQILAKLGPMPRSKRPASHVIDEE